MIRLASNYAKVSFQPWCFVLRGPKLRSLSPPNLGHLSHCPNSGLGKGWQMRAKWGHLPSQDCRFIVVCFPGSPDKDWTNCSWQALSINLSWNIRKNQFPLPEDCWEGRITGFMWAPHSSHARVLNSKPLLFPSSPPPSSPTCPKFHQTLATWKLTQCIQWHQLVN